MFDVDEYLNNADIKITKLPDDLDPNKMLREAIYERYGKCPYCGNTEISTGLPYHDYIRLNGKWWQIWKPLTWCEKKHFTCNKCGMEWESPWYPDNIVKLNK